MLYTLLAEPRSGGTSLANWIGKSLPTFVVAQEPYFIGNDYWVDGEDKNNVKWIERFDNLFIREIYREDDPLDKLINLSDKVICLYRKNWYEQIKSNLYQEVNGSKEYMTSYKKEDVDSLVTEKMIFKRYDSFIKYKSEFQNYIKENNFISISYEDLYYGNGIEIVKKHFNINTDIKFPLNKRHLKDINNNEIGLVEVPPTPTPTPTPTVTPTPTPTPTQNPKKLI